MTSPYKPPDPLYPYSTLDEIKKWDAKREEEDAKAFLFSFLCSIFLVACLVWYWESRAPKPETQRVSDPAVVVVQPDVYYDRYYFDEPVYPCYSKKDRAWLFSTTDDGRYGPQDRSLLTPVLVWTLPRVAQGPYCKK
jgi:hypothetical protein